MSRVTHFEIPADDPERAIRFYSDVFGWKFQKWDGPMEYWLVETGTGKAGIDGGMMRRQNPDASVVNTIEVDSLDAAIRAVEQKGGKIVIPKWRSQEWVTLRISRILKEICSE